MKREIKALFKNNPGRSFKNKDVAKKLNITAEHEYSALKAAVHKLVNRAIGHVQIFPACNI